MASSTQEQYDHRWDAILGRDEEPAVDDSVIDAYNEERLVSKYDKQTTDQPTNESQ